VSSSLLYMWSDDDTSEIYITVIRSVYFRARYSPALPYIGVVTAYVTTHQTMCTRGVAVCGELPPCLPSPSPRSTHTEEGPRGPPLWAALPAPYRGVRWSTAGHLVALGACEREGGGTDADARHPSILPT
jgi:hypothetical protein